MIMEKKQSTSINTLCAGCPKEFSEYLSYCRSLKFEASPNIKYLRQLFRDLYTQQGFPLNTYGDADWDWNRLTDGNPPTASTNAAPSDGGNGESGDRKVNSKPYGVYGDANGRPNSAANNRPQTATTNVAQSGSVGDSRPDSAAGNRNMESGGGGVFPRTRPETPAANSTAVTGANNSASGNKDNASGGGSNGASRGWTGEGGGGGRRPQSAQNRAPSTDKLPTASGSGGKEGTQKEGTNANGDAYVVAGAKSMMTYRRARSGNADNQAQQQGGQAPPPNGAGPTWGRPKATGRPKSAGIIGSRVPSGGGSTGNSSGVRSSGGGNRSNARAPQYSQTSKAQVYRGSVG
eukprot:CAMPEP_0114341522 /NCGR_PEP_ID=MMETSP0101-20121206/9106_1 /TAXON_ID=38822 ORGANISM="Pteridomonas danica, Strain PT" /NCGR_SAMPLE_ID=MMETSP0101 /ASSEMBLY_ACC=CAM_ASM_000211 /LENGTH=347 /DNA_ID=CAMNT_0001475159 /DNA_START=832 /DNA_END=1875 /DNA_ORIENTATION=-